jgi:hypothetical protein
MISKIKNNKEVHNRRDSLQAGGLTVLPTLEGGGRGRPVKAGQGKILKIGGIH